MYCSGGWSMIQWHNSNSPMLTATPKWIAYCDVLKVLSLVGSEKLQVRTCLIVFFQKMVPPLCLLEKWRESTTPRRSEGNCPFLGPVLYLLASGFPTCILDRKRLDVNILTHLCVPINFQIKPTRRQRRQTS